MKTHVTLTIDEDIIIAHRQIGTNVSKVCNDFLAGYFEETTKLMLKEKKKEVKNLKKML